MQIVQATTHTDVLDAGGQPTYSLREGHRYLLHDGEAGHGLRQGVLRLMAGLDRKLPCYRAQRLDRDRLLLPFIGRKGDAIVTASCLAALKQRYPDVIVDITAPDSTREVFGMLPCFGQLFAYPIESDRLADYDYYLSFEAVDAIRDGARRSCVDVFSACLQTPAPEKPIGLVVAPAVQDRWRWVRSHRPGVALHVGRPDSLRSYPHDQLQELTALLVEQSFAVHWVGTSNPKERPAPRQRSDAINLVGRTPTSPDLAAVLACMDLVITDDSFPMHLAGALGVPTIALFTTTDAVIGSDYPSVIAVQSEAACSPCAVADGRCPLGHAECIAHRHRSIDPPAVASLACAMIHGFCGTAVDQRQAPAP